MSKLLTHNDTRQIEALLLGRKVTAVPDAKALVLDDGTVLRVVPNKGCGGCSNGTYWVSALNGTDNVITRVEFVYEPVWDDDGWWETREPGEERPLGHYRIFVFTGNERINLLDVEGDDGNGYYGSGFDLAVWL